MRDGRGLSGPRVFVAFVALAAAVPRASRAAEPGPLTVPLPEPTTKLGPPAPASERVTLTQAVQRALARNPNVAVALAEVERADGLVREARAAWLPNLTGNGLFTHADHERILNGRVISAQNQVTGNLSLTVPLVAPQGWVADRHARDGRRVVEANAVDIRRLVAFATANAYLAVLAQHRQVRSTESALTNAKAHADFAHKRLEGGLGHSIDDVRAQQDVAGDEVQLQADYTGLARAREALGVLMGTDGPVDTIKDVDLGAMPSLPTALEDARSRRPDVGTQRARVVSAEKFRKDVWAFYAPYLAAVGQPFVQAGSALQPHTGWQAQLVLTLPLYDGGFRYGAAQERDALLTEARANLDATMRQAQSEVRISFEAMLRADQALVSSRAAATLARQAYDLATLAYKAGATTNLEVIDAAQRSRDADGDAARAEDVARRARLDLLVSSGRFP